MPRGIDVIPGRGVIHTVACDVCKVRLPLEAVQVPLRIGGAAGLLDLCDMCRQTATIADLEKALRYTVGRRRSASIAKDPNEAVEGVFDKGHAPCPLCTRKFTSPTGVWLHIERGHHLQLTRQQKDKVWGIQCFFGCGFPTGTARSMSQHLGRAHGTAQGGQLFTGLAQALANGDESRLARAVIRRLKKVGTPPVSRRKSRARASREAQPVGVE